jgi:hypothetical protein
MAEELNPSGSRCACRPSAIRARTAIAEHLALTDRALSTMPGSRQIASCSNAGLIALIEDGLDGFGRLRRSSCAGS